MHTWHAQCVEAMLNEALLTRGLLTFQLPRYIHLWGLIDGRAFPSTVRFLLRSDWGTKLLHAVIVKGDESASVREREKAKGRMKSCLSMCTKELSWFVPGTFALQRWMNNCKLSRQLWYCPHTSHLHPCTALEVVVRLAIKQCLTRFHSVFHLDAQLLLKVQKVLLLMAYFTWP